MNYKKITIAFVILAAFGLMALQLYTIRKRRLSSTSELSQHLHDDECCSCH